MRNDDTPSAGRFARWAALLVLPLILAALAIPRVLERLKTTRQAVPASLAGAATATAPSGAAEVSATPEPPRHPEAPGAAEMEAARAAEVEAARLKQRHLAASTTITPREAVTTADGEKVAPFQGFGLSIESTPAGARVLVGGKEVGETPIVTSVDCVPGDAVEVGVEKRGLRPARRTVRCRADALLELRVKLAR
jgi:hypothetical protein